MLYLIECTVPCGDHGTFIVRANNKQEAFNKVWNEHYLYENIKARNKGYDPYNKSDFIVRNIEKEVLKDEDMSMI